MPKLIVLNISTEQMMGGVINPEFLIRALKRPDRNSWLADEDDIIVASSQISSEFLNYVSENYGYSNNKIKVITPKKSSSNPQILSDEVLLSDDIINSLKSEMCIEKKWNLCACYQTSGLIELCRKLNIDMPSGFEFIEQKGPDLFNRKSHFRRIAAGINLSIPKGFVVSNPLSLASSINNLIDETGILIIKQDRGGGGMGNLALTKTKDRQLPGVSKVIPFDLSIEEHAEKIWSELTDSWNNELVIECYHKSSVALYCEYFIDSNGQPSFLSNGSIRVEKDQSNPLGEMKWIGLEIPAILPLSTNLKVVSEATRLANQMGQIGYRGYVNIDMIVTLDNEYIFNEINARWGGGTAMHFIGNKLLGKNYMNEYYLSSLREVPSKSFQEALHILKSNDLKFNMQRKTGVIILRPSIYLDNSIECLIIEKSIEKVRAIENKILILFQGDR
ncbi:hypothetical protein [Fluviispira sanaruensis]|uniref:ATP-grasp domain-containing protein n=1 Tax=Fluviispira sanaruensis TaxID=2493639 RepID=A0A4P2VME7_FLUSA|nr:hypothetical protein [Fluviispira sanaruensis]BBH54556.1 hypothetical protein JCM31447_30270 [Fluviispira sanaruensis]